MGVTLPPRASRRREAFWSEERIGGLIYGPLVARFAPEAKGHGVPEVMLAVNRLGGRIRSQVPVVNRSLRRCASAPAARSAAKGRSFKSALP